MYKYIGAFVIIEARSTCNRRLAPTSVYSHITMQTLSNQMV